MTITYRKIEEAEYPFLKQMLYEALFVSPGHTQFPKSIVDTPEIRKYVESWNEQVGDLSIVAVSDKQLVGAIWGRTFSPDKRGYGYVDAFTPEISMAIQSTYRNKGIGTELLNRIAIAYSAIGVEQLSLSVDQLNPAKNLYDRCGYTPYEEQGTALTMIKLLS